MSRHALRLVKPPRYSKPKSTRAQRAHREVAWCVYIAEGFAANLRHAEFMNAHEMPPKARHLLLLAIKQTEGIIRAMREHL